MNILSGRKRYVFPAVLVGLVAAAGTVGVTSARGAGASIGNGVVVIETELGYQGGQAAGTGMVLTSGGEVLTNNHVVNGATDIRVVIPGSGQTYSAKVVGYTASDDVAVIQLNGASHLKTISVGDSSHLSVGQAVTALGNAGGTGSLTPANGRITGLGKSITAGDEQGGDSEQLTGMIETDANVQPGDSGGPLLDGSGKVIGMDTAASSGSGFGFGYGGDTSNGSDAYAIPISRALTIAKQIESGNGADSVHVGGTAWLGVQVQSADSAASSNGGNGGYGYGDPNGYGDPYGYGDPNGYGDPYGYGGGSSQTATSGALIAGVVSGSPAESAGLAAGDVITGVDGQSIDGPDALTSVLQGKHPGEKVTLAVTDQNGNAQSVGVTLGAGPAR